MKKNEKKNYETPTLRVIAAFQDVTAGLGVTNADGNLTGS